MAQSEKPCLYEIQNDQSDPTNRLVPDREETLTLEAESQSKLNKDLVKPYEYTKLNSLYENFKPTSQGHHKRLAHANEVRKKMWRKSFVTVKPNILKNIAFLPVSKSIRKSRQAYNVMTNNINHFRELVDQAWEKPSHNHYHAPTTLDMEVLIKTCLMPLTTKPQNDRVIHKTNISRTQLKSNQMKDKVMPNNSQVKDKKTEVEDHHRISSISNKTKSVTACNDSLKSKTSNELRRRLEVAQKEKDNIQLNVDKLKNASKSLNKLIDYQIVENCKKGLRYNAVPPPHTGKFLPPKHDLSYTGLEEFAEEPLVENVPKVSRPSVEGPKEVRKYDCHHHQNQFKNQKMVKPIWNYNQRVNHEDFAKKSHPSAKRNMVPRAALMKTGLLSVNVARQNLSRTAITVNAARPVNTAHPKRTMNDAKHMSYFSKTTHSSIKRPIQKQTTFKNSYFNQRINTVKGKTVIIARPKAVVNTARLKVVLNAAKEIDRGYVTFGGNPKGGKSLAKNNVLFTKTECIVLSLESKLIDENQVLVRVPRQNNMYSVDLKKIVPKGATKDETSGILKSIITRIENQVDHKYSVARTPQQNGVAEKRNMTLIEAARTMIVDSKLPTTFWAEAFSTVCYVQNRVLVVKPHNKTLYELFHGRTLALSLMKPFGFPVIILNTTDHLGKFDGKADEGFFVEYSLNSKAFEVFNSRTKIVEEPLHVRFSKNTPNSVGSGSDWLFDIDAPIKTMNYVLVVAQSNEFSSTKASNGACDARKEKEPAKDYILLLLWTVNEDLRKDNRDQDQEKDDSVNSTNRVNTVSSTVNASSLSGVNVVAKNTSIELPNDSNMHKLEDISIFEDTTDDEDVGAEADLNNLESTFQVIQTRRMSKNLEEQGFICTLKRRKHHKDLQNYLFACFLSQEEPKKVIQALTDPSWIEAMQEELLQFKIQEVWTIVDLPNRNGAIGSKWVFRNKLDEKGIVIRNKARLVAQGYTQEEEIDYNEVFSPVARIKEIRLFLAYASFKDIVVYQMDVKSAFLYRKIEEEVYVCQPPGFEDPDFLDKVYKVEKVLYRLHQAPRAWKELCIEIEN
nr:hypothetical protein [Tanacetum cinerariifolium]